MVDNKVVKLILSAISTLAVSTAFLLPGSAMADSTCQGLSEAKCGSASGCNWIGGYKKADGKAVSAYCRSAGKKSDDKPTAKKAVDEKKMSPEAAKPRPSSKVATEKPADDKKAAKEAKKAAKEKAREAEKAEKEKAKDKKVPAKAN